MATVVAPVYEGNLPRTIGISRKRADFTYEVNPAGIHHLVLVTDRWVLRHPHPFVSLEEVTEFAYKVYFRGEYIHSQHWEVVLPGTQVEVNEFPR